MLMKYVLCMYEHEYVEEIRPCAGGACASCGFTASPYFGNFTIRVYSAPYHSVRPIMSRRQKLISFIFIHIRHPYLLLCTCSMRAGGMVWWSCRTRWHPEESRTPQTWRCQTLPACNSRWMLPGQRCKQSSPWWETLLQQIYPKGKNKKILII